MMMKFQFSNVAREPVDFLKVVRLFLCVTCMNYRNKPKIFRKVKVDLSGSTFQNKNKIKNKNNLRLRKKFQEVQSENYNYYQIFTLSSQWRVGGVHQEYSLIKESAN